MNSTKALLATPGTVLLVAAAGCLLIGWPASAQDGPHLGIIQPGGMPAWPVITGIAQDTNGVDVTWDGPSGYYRLFQSPNLRSPNWQPVGGPNPNRTATLSVASSNAFFRVSGPAPQFAGSQACLECHQDTHDTVMKTRHSSATTSATFLAQGGQTNGACLRCHSVGNGLPTGFTMLSVTPQLAGVQCENCHGPAANHAANPDDPTVRPRVEPAATVCGGCHNASWVPAAVAASHRPYYEEWNTSGHRAVRTELQADFAGSQGATVYIPSCGRCHSGTVRESLLEREPLPDGHEAGAVGIACATCHDPHQVYAHTNVLSGLVTNGLTGAIITNNQLGMIYTNQLRYPLASTNDYFLSTSDVFTNKYDPDINVCAQCHNHRGAAWSSSSRAPHHSPQYNMLLGTVGELDLGTPSVRPASHALFEKQCVRCHVQAADAVSATQPAVSGHSFQVQSFDTCRECHPQPELLVQFTTTAVSNQIQFVKGLLDQWATTKAPEALRTKYGALAWEYTNPGDLSTGTAGPSSSEQTLIPVNIQKARFDLYLVLYDGSYGVHNGPYVITLLDTAQNWVQEELSQ